jgi:chromosome segregation ATPase
VRAAALAAAADQALRADAQLQQVPTAQIQELAQLVSTLFSQRALAQRLSAELSGAPPATLARFPQIRAILPDLAKALTQGAATDHHYETQYAKAKSSIEGVERLAAQIAAAKDSLAQARLAFDWPPRARAGHKEKETQMESAANTAEAVIAEMAAAIADISSEFATKLQDYLASAEQVRLGFGKHIAFYQ